MTGGLLRLGKGPASVPVSTFFRLNKGDTVRDLRLHFEKMYRRPVEHVRLAAVPVDDVVRIDLLPGLSMTVCFADKAQTFAILLAG
ncbi:hypothetical protein IWQ56_006837 [Coemansia nantahalensis]|uniref:Uncharacterized protein n=2 Tax=Coemansia TaxID=4863 RepID=A0ACC1KW45_9FUNG|nr:hypothetical protein IWQ56_006837 [Coemansia nantahalensis]KAJ2760623.1 hypothetical protein IWQ57_006260 [Coemansia nantahalensis]KAJ2796063.1 hypothetical protein H4R21_004859 [Coemansia helicoidea]